MTAVHPAVATAPAVSGAPDAADPILVVHEPVRALRIAADSVETLAELLDADDATVLGRPESVQTSAPVRLGLIDPTPKRLAAARSIVQRAVAATQLGEPVKAWRGARDIWFTDRPLLHEPGTGTAFVFPGLEVEFAPRVADVAAHFGLPLPGFESGSIGRHARGVVALGRLLDEALHRIGIVPAAVAGQSIGEWTAMAAAGMRRPQDMDQMMGGFDPDAIVVPEVDYAVLGCGVARAQQALSDVSDVVLSHDNAPNQVMVCGRPDAVAELVAALRADGVIAQILNFRSGFHTPMLAPYLAPYQVMAQQLNPQTPHVPVWSATTAAPYPDDPASIQDLFLRNLLEPVMFRSMIEAMYAAGSRVFVQAGSGQLASLIDDILGDQPHLAIAATSRKRDGLDQLLRVATAVWVEGGDPRPAALSAPEPLPDNAFGAGFPRTVRFGTDNLPWVLDHSFFQQAPGWPDQADLRPVVPATSLADFIAGWAAEAVPGSTAVAVRDVRLLRWVLAEPASEAVVSVIRTGPDTVKVTVGDHCEGTVQLARNYPPPDDQPSEPEQSEPLAPPRIGASSLYAERVMFHDGTFRAINRVHGVGEYRVRGELTVTGVPGSLMDNVGQLIGVWLEHHGHGTVAYPVKFDALRFFGPEPPAGQRVEAEVQIRSLGTADLVADAQVFHRGRLIARIDGWHDRRFLTDPALMPGFRFPQRWPQAKTQQGGWVLVADRWADLTGRELIAGLYLSRAERAELADTSPRGRRSWLLGRIAAKDAVRDLLWAQGHGQIFPAQIRVGNAANGQPSVSGLHGLQLPAVDISIAHSGEFGVAIARPAAPGTAVGIDVERVAERSPGVHDITLGPAEQQLLTALASRGSEPEDLWFTRFWSAKEAVAKAEGTGLHGRPQRFRVVAARPSVLDVVVDDVQDGPEAPSGHHPGRRYRVHCTVRTPPGQPAHHYVVAWTTGAAQQGSGPNKTQEENV